MAKNYRLYAYREEMDFVSFIQKFNKLEDATQYTNIHEPDEDYEGCELVLYNPVSGKNPFYGMQNLAEDEALRIHEKEMANDE